MAFIVPPCIHPFVCRVRKDNAPENTALLRHVSLNFIEADKPVQRGVQTRHESPAGMRPTSSTSSA